MKIYLIPTPIASESLNWVPPIIKEVIQNTTYFFVENERTARRFISSLELGIDIRSLNMFVLDKTTKKAAVLAYLSQIPAGSQVGVMSEAGCPGVADPGALLVEIAHEKGYGAIPLPGASSILLTLMASGFSGQRFTFHGYLPIDREKRKATLNRLEVESQKWGTTQLFMETPYRNNGLLDDILNNCQPSTLLCIGAGIGEANQLISTQSVGKWKRQKLDLHKIPTIFALSAESKKKGKG